MTAKQITFFCQILPLLKALRQLLIRVSCCRCTVWCHGW